jgi:hypothetical protein
MSLFIQTSAIISDCGTYRYELRRIWDDSKPPYVSGMLNPSTADDKINDPTIVRNIRRAQANGCGSLIVWNLGAGRASDPEVWKAMADPIGPENNTHIERILKECRARHGIAAVGWGNDGSFMGRDKVAIRIAAKVGVVFRLLDAPRLLPERKRRPLGKLKLSLRVGAAATAVGPRECLSAKRCTFVRARADVHLRSVCNDWPPAAPGGLAFQRYWTSAGRCSPPFANVYSPKTP